MRRLIAEQIRQSDPTPKDAVSVGGGQRRYPLYTWNLDRTEYDVIYLEAKDEA